MAEKMKNAIWVIIIIALVALVVAVIGAIGAILTEHLRWIELSWVSMAASLLAIALIGMKNG